MGIITIWNNRSIAPQNKTNNEVCTCSRPFWRSHRCFWAYYGYGGYYGRGYGYGGYGLGYGYGGYGLGYGRGYYGHYLGKRSADAAPEADAWYGRGYGYGYGRGYGYGGYGYVRFGYYG